MLSIQDARVNGTYGQACPLADSSTEDHHSPVRSSTSPTPLPPTAELLLGLQKLRASRGVQPYKARLEELLYELPADQSDALMMFIKESRGAWALLLGAKRGRLLFVGDALSGTPVALGTLGFDVTVVDTSLERLQFTVDRGEALVPGTTQGVHAGSDGQLPFLDRAFDVVVLEGGLPAPSTGWGFGLGELRRVAASEILVTADNRLGYKRSTGRRGAFRRDPRVLLREILKPARGEATLPTTRRRVAGTSPDATWPVTQAYSLYPHALEFSHVVALDGDRPQLTIGPRERKNRIKMVGHRLGFFRWLTPSFAIHARRSRPHKSNRLTRMLEQLSQRIGEPTPVPDIFVATRSNDALIHTAPASRAALGQSDAEGRWTLHIPLQPTKRKMVATHHTWLVRLRRDLPDVPVPEPLFVGELEGTEVAVERRLGGLSGTDLTGDLVRTRRMFLEAAQHAALLVDHEATALDADFQARMFTPRFERVSRLIRTASTSKAMRALRDRVEERFIGAKERLAIYHADLRGKHIQVDAQGSVTGYLDWGASEAGFLPFIDLLHLVVHQRKQEVGGAFGDAWRALRDPATRRPYEHEAFEAYIDSARLDPADLAFYLETYPLFIAGMAERNWDYSRPDWVHRQFRI